MLALNKYGVENFSFETFEFPKNELNEKEKYFIKELNTMVDGYNLKPGGTGNYEHKPSEESRFKMGHNRGKQLSEEHKKRISESHKELNFNHSDITTLEICIPLFFLFLHNLYNSIQTLTKSVDKFTPFVVI